MSRYPWLVSAVKRGIYISVVGALIIISIIVMHLIDTSAAIM